MSGRRAIVGERISLIPMKRNAASVHASWAEWMRDPDVNRFYGGPDAATTPEAAARLLPSLSGHRFLIASNGSGEWLGGASLHDVDAVNRNAFIGIFIGDPANRGNGLGGEAIRLLLGYGFAALRLHAIMLSVHADNAPAIACYARAGFEPAGRRREWLFRDGAFVDKLYMEILARDYFCRSDSAGIGGIGMADPSAKAFLETLLGRYSYRGKYGPAPVPREDLRAILEAGLAAPSGCNTQTTDLIGADDPALIARLGAVIGGGFATAPAAVCVLTRPLIAWGDTVYNVQDYAAAIENMLLAIAALGYASCWLEGQVTGDPAVSGAIRDILGVPDGYEVVAYLPVGVAAEEGGRAKKKRFEERASFNGFSRGDPIG